MRTTGRKSCALVLSAVLLLPAMALLGPAPAAAIIPVTDYAHIVVNQYWHYVHYVQFALQIYQHYQALANQLLGVSCVLKESAQPTVFFRKPGGAGLG